MFRSDHLHVHTLGLGMDSVLLKSIYILSVEIYILQNSIFETRDFLSSL